jgi:hypothetical protein
LTSIFANVAEIAAERMEELAGQASLRDAGTTAGIATDKLLALSSDPFSQANQQHLHVHLQKVDLIGQWNEMISKLSSSTLETKDNAAKALPSGPDPQATQPTVTTQPAERCAREEKDRAKRE